MNRSQSPTKLLIALVTGVVVLAGVVWIAIVVSNDSTPVSDVTDAAPANPDQNDGAPGSAQSGGSSNSGSSVSSRTVEVVREDETASVSRANEGVVGDGDREEEDFTSRFARLAATEDWEQLAAFVRQSVIDCESLKEFLPELLACLETVEGKVGYFGLGQDVRIGLMKRQDLADGAELLREAFMSQDSLLVTGAIAQVLLHVDRENPDAAVRGRIEDLMIHRNIFIKGLPKEEQQVWKRMMLSTHVGYSSSVLFTINFMESLQQTGLERETIDRMWKTNVMYSFNHEHYGTTEVPELVQYLSSFSTRYIADASAPALAVQELKKIWGSFREELAYEEAVRLANEAEDEATQKAFDEIAAHWLAQQEDE